MKFFLFCFIVLMIFGTNANAQKVDTLMPGKVLPRWANLKEQTVKFSIFTTSKEGKLLYYSILERTVKPFPFNGKDTWVSIQTAYGKDKIDVDSTIFLPKTYVPVAYRTDIQSEKHKEKVDFDGMKIAAEIIYPDSVVTKDQSAKFPVYSVVMDQDILQAMPFAKGTKFVIKGINPGAHYSGISNRSYEVIGEEKVDVAGTKIDCWKIASGKSVIWYSKKSQELIKHQYAFPNGNTFWKIRML